MFQQLVQTLVNETVVGSNPPTTTATNEASRVLSADPMDLILHMEKVWYDSNLGGPAGLARRTLIGTGALDAARAPIAAAPGAGTNQPAWDHLVYAFALESTRAAQIFARVVREFRSGENLGIPSPATQRWLDATETILFGAPNLFPAWLSTSAIRPDPEAVRRNAYWRMFGMDLPFGTEDNRPFAYSKGSGANVDFVPLFEELLYELWQAISNIRNAVGSNQTDDDRIFLLAQQLGNMLRARRLGQLLTREEFAAVAMLGWIDLTLSADTPVIVDLRANAPSPAGRLQLIGERVGLAAHSRAEAFFGMASDLSLVLRALENNLISQTGLAWVLYSVAAPAGATALQPGTRALVEESRRIITEWSRASGRDLKNRKSPIEVRSVAPAQAALTRR